MNKWLLKENVISTLLKCLSIYEFALNGLPLNNDIARELVYFLLLHDSIRENFSIFNKVIPYFMQFAHIMENVLKMNII